MLNGGFLLVGFRPCRSYNGWHRDAQSLRAWALRSVANTDRVWPFIFESFGYLTLFPAVRSQFFTASVGGLDAGLLQVFSSVRPRPLGSGLLRPLVWTLSALCPRV